jgi:type I restriction enzyme S subunit
MDKMKKKIPALRFPGFDGEWERNVLGNISEWASGGTPSKEELTYWNGDLPWISASSMRGSEFSDSELKITNEGLISGSRLALKGSILILVRGSMLFKKIPVGIATRDVAFNQDVKSITITTKSTSKFILYWFKSSENELLNMVVGTGIGAGKLELSDLKRMRLFLPTLPEQQKIADFLTAVDDKINQLTRKKTLLEQYKKGVMQKILSQEIRFPEFEGEWSNVSFNDVADKSVRWSITGGPFGSDLKSEDYTESGVRIIQLQNIGDGEFRDDYKIFTTEEKADELRACNIYPNEIILSKMGDPVARACFIPTDNNRYLMASDGIRLVVDSSMYNNYYVLNYINSPFFRKNAIAVSTGSTRQRIGLSDLKKLKINFPTLPEQQKIADFLTGIDKKIELVNTQLEKTREWKRGLLQQMFV